MFDPGILLLTQGSRKTEASDPGYVFQAIRDGIYDHEWATVEIVIVISFFLAVRHGVFLTVEDFSYIIFKLKKLQPKLKMVIPRMRRTSDGYYSEDVEMFCGRLHNARFAEYGSDSGFRPNVRGLKFFEEVVGEFFNAEPLVFTWLCDSIWDIMYPKFFKDPII